MTETCQKTGQKDVRRNTKRNVSRYAKKNAQECLEDMPDRMPQDLPEAVSEDMKGRMPKEMSEYRSNRLPEECQKMDCQKTCQIECWNSQVECQRIWQMWGSLSIWGNHSLNSSLCCYVSLMFFLPTGLLSLYIRQVRSASTQAPAFVKRSTDLPRQVLVGHQYQSHWPTLVIPFPGFRSLCLSTNGQELSWLS